MLELAREEHARREVDQLAVVERDQRMRDEAALVVEHGQLADERGRQQLFDRLGEHAHDADDNGVREVCALGFALDHDVRQRLEPGLVAQELPRPACVVERDVPRAFERAR